MTMRKIVRREIAGGVYIELLGCGHLGLVCALGAGANAPRYPEARNCKDCVARDARRRREAQ